MYAALVKENERLMKEVRRIYKRSKLDLETWLDGFALNDEELKNFIRLDFEGFKLDKENKSPSLYLDKIERVAHISPRKENGI